MFEQIGRKLGKIRYNLYSLDNQPIGKAVLIVLIFLDIFILISIFDGLSNHTQQLTQPYTFIPQHCREIVINKSWNETNRFDKLAKIISSARNSPYVKTEKEKNLERHLICKPIVENLLAIEGDEATSKKLSQFFRVGQQTTQLNKRFKNINTAYDTSLLQDIAGKTKNRVKTESLKKEVELQTKVLDKLVDTHHSLILSLDKNKKIRNFFDYVDTLSDADKTKLRNDLRQLNFWNPVKRLGMEMIFLLPLFFTFYFWNVKSVVGKRPFQTLVSSHLLVVAFVPVLFKVIMLVYDILPKKLLTQIIEFLESLKLVALWYYLTMAIVIIIALAVIYFFQKKLFSGEALIEKRISKGACQNCGKHLPINTTACPFCGFEQFKKCSHCNKLTYVFAKFCKECGKILSEKL